MKELLFSRPYTVTSFLVERGFLLIEWPNKIDDDINESVLNLSETISEELDNIIDLVPSYSSLGVFYNYKEVTYNHIKEQIKALSIHEMSRVDRSIIEIPVCYDIKFGLDLEEISALKNMSPAEVISRHTSALYKVAFIGFLPGFPYLSGLDPLLSAPRKGRPRIQIPKGSVAIGGDQTGIYPYASPGGWNIIGNCPLRLFNASSDHPSRFRPGDKIKMVSISIDQYNTINQSEHYDD